MRLKESSNAAVAKATESCVRSHPLLFKRILGARGPCDAQHASLSKCYEFNLAIQKSPHRLHEDGIINCYVAGLHARAADAQAAATVDVAFEIRG